MKFAKYLDDNCIPEWKAAYIDYKKGKKLIKRAQAQLSFKDFQKYRGRHVSPSETPLVNSSRPSKRTSYGATRREDGGSDHSSEELANPGEQSAARKTLSRNDSPSKPEPAMVAGGSPSSPGLLRRLSSWVITDPVSGARKPNLDMELVPENEAQGTFYDFVRQQVEKVDDFYKEREEEAGKRLGELRFQLQEMKDRKKVLQGKRRSNIVEQNAHSDYTRSIVANVRSLFSYADVDLLNSHPIGDDPGEESTTQLLLTYRVSRRRLKIAIQEFYHSLELLQSYRNMNLTALTKVLKKFDKTVKAKSSPIFLKMYSEETYIGTSNFLDKIMHDSENVFAKYFYKGDRKHAVAALRSKVRTEDYRFTMLRIGVYAGLAIALGLEGLVRSQVAFMMDVQRTFLLQVWGAFFFLILMSLLFGLSCYIWTKNKINYVFIFEYNVRHNLNWMQYLELPVFIALIYSILFWMCFSNFFPNFTIWYPLVFVVATALLIFLPLPILHFSTRRWFITAHARLLVSGLSSVRFQDVFLGDLYNSLTYSLGNSALFFCLYRFSWHDPTQCGSSRSALLGFFTTLPGIFRLAQCLRRYYDTRHYFPHLINALKYSMTILQYTTLSLWRIQKYERFKILYIIFATINSLYTSTWDLVMDVSLLQPGASSVLLRTHRAYSATWVYYAFIVLDPVLRFSWVFYIIYSDDIQHAAALSFYIGLAECLRRIMWAIFRVENEHVANVLMYRATRELPLPYAVPTPEQVESQKRRSGDRSKTRHEQPRIAEAHATDFERKPLEGMHMDEVDADSDGMSDTDPTSDTNAPQDTDNEEQASHTE